MKLASVLIGNNVIETLNFESANRHNSYILNLSGETKLLTLFDEPTSKTIQPIIVQSDKKAENYYPFNLHSEKQIAKGTSEQGHDIDKYDIYEVNIDCSKRREIAAKMQQNHPNLLGDTGQNVTMNGIFKLDNGALFGRFKEPDRIKQIKIHINLFDSPTTNLNDAIPDSTADVELFLGSNEKIYDVVLDFGSEASQMAISNRGEETIDRSSFINLFSLIKEEMRKGQGEASDYIQYDPSDDYLYRSRFFVRKMLDSEIISGAQPWERTLQTDNLLLLLSKSKDGEEIAQHYIPMPNVKIAGYGGVELEKVKVGDQQTRIDKIKDNYFYRYAINAFLRQALKNIESNCPDLGDQSKSCCLVAFHILMPNVYGYKRLHQNLHYIQDDLQKMTKSETPSVVGIEASAVSESDASFIGNVSLSNPKDFPMGKYLILDAGKGTLDFSVLNYDTSKHMMFNNLYRDGIIGAGNAMSYAMLLVILHGLLEAETPGITSADSKVAIQDYIFNKILGDSTDPSKANANGSGDTASLVKLMKLLDEYKVLYYHEPSVLKAASNADLALSGDFKNLELEGLVQKIEDIVNNKVYVSDSEQFMDRMMDSLIDSVAEKIEDRFVVGNSGNKDTNLPDYIVFAGRGFLLEPLRNKMENRLNKVLNKTLVRKQFDTKRYNVTLKNICLVISARIKDGTYDSRLLGEPEMLSNNTLTGTPTNKNMPNTPTPPSQKPSLKESFIQAMKDIVKEVFRGIKGPSPVDYGYLPKKNMGIRQFREGIRKNVNNHSDQIQIGNCRYFLPAHLGPGSFEIFFADGEIWARQKGETGTISQAQDFSGNHVFESLFPYCKITRIEDVVIPPATTRTTSPTSTSSGGGTNSSSTTTTTTTNASGLNPIDVFNK